MAKRALRIGIDIDDTIYPWYAQAHRAVAREYRDTGLFPKPKTWHPYREYGISRGEWEGILRDAVIDGSLHSADPIPGAVAAVQRLHRYVEMGILGAGTRIIAVTARGETFSETEGPAWLSELVREQTWQWLRRWQFGFGPDVVFTAHKNLLNLDYLIDDGLHNIHAVGETGCQGVIMDQTWNQDETGAYVGVPRVSTVNQFTNLVLAAEEER